jgi:hypothetical protein
MGSSALAAIPRFRGFNFSNSSINNYSTNNVLISGNTFTGSYSDNPTKLADAMAFGAINASANALAAIEFNGVSNATIEDNSFLYPQVQAYLPQAASELGAQLQSAPKPISA